GDFVAGIVLAVAGLEGFHFGDCGGALGGVACAVFQGQFLHQVGAFEDDAAAGGSGGGFSEVFNKFAAGEQVVDAVVVADGFGGELDDGAGFDVAARADVVTHAGGHGAEGLALVVPICV